MKRVLVLFIGVMLLAGCASTKPSPPGVLGDTYSKLGPGPEGGAKLRWLKPDVDFSKYNKILLDPITLVASEDDANRDMDSAKLKEVTEECNQALAGAIAKKYPVITTPGPDVARVRFGILDLKRSYPAFAGVSSVLPIGLALTLLKRPVTGTWTAGGSTVAQLLATDSTTNEVIAAAQDNYEAGFFERFTQYGSAENAFEHWGDRIVKFLDEAKDKK